MMDLAGLPVVPVDIEALATVERELLPEWAEDWTDRRKKAIEAAKKK